MDYKKELVKGKSVVLTTTNGTVIFQKAKKALYRIIGGFVNLTMVHNFLLQQLNTENYKINDIFFLCAGNNGKFSYEDALCAGAFINLLTQSKPELHLTDTALALLDLYKLHSTNLYDFIKEREHATILHNLGFDEDIKICTEIDRYPVVPVFSGSSIVRSS